MQRFTRFVVHQKVPGETRQVGLFTAAYYLREEGDLSRHDRERLSTLLSWFEARLTVPPRDIIPARSIFWYRDVGPFARGMWELARLLREYDFSTELITARFVGRVVYRDEHQVAAVPPRRCHR